MNRIYLVAAFLLLGAVSGFARKKHDAPGTGNPVIPGYFADPTIKKFGDTYYMYATTDGSGAGFGPAQVWTSKDFVNWTLMPMNWPDSHWIWAPDVIRHTDGRYYYFYCQPCIIHCGVSETPRGPWKNILGESEAVLVPDRFVTNAITLDGQTFVDDDGSVYLYWGTWGIYKGFGCGAGKMTPDLKGFTETRLIPNTEAVDFFEAPFVLKRNGIYYFMYSSGSCHDHTYRVQYATSDHPLGPYEYKGCILETNEDGTVHGPGHHSILKEGDDYYIVYHRHDNPHSNRGFHRQLCMDKMEFAADGSIRKVIPTHKGVGALAPSVVKSENLALGAGVRASSCYDDNFRAEYAVDDNNGTLWRPRGMGQEWLEIDLGSSREIQTVWTQFEYGTQFYQYLIETSVDGKHWSVFADKRNNHLAGSPMVDFGKAEARYVRLTFTGGQKNGFGGAVWNVKVFGGIEEALPQQWLGLTAADWDGREWQNNEGMLGGAFVLKEGAARTCRIEGRDALMLEPGTVLEYCHSLLSPSKEHTLSGLVYRSGKWRSYEAEHCLSQGMISLRSGNEPLVITNLRYYNWKLEPAERAYDAATDVVRLPAADRRKRGLVVSITADDFAVGDTVPYLTNRGVKGYFEALKTPVVVKETEGKKAFHFDGSQLFRSSFSLPATLQDNAPYTLEAWVLNDSIAENECVADFTTSHDELEKIMLVNGTEPRCGVINHYGWYEDAGYKGMKELTGRWQHIYICFDGRMEQVYINGEQVSGKDIQLLVKPSQFVTLGRNAEGEWLFTGYLHSLKLWDEYIPLQGRK
ncbi:family 43 glycosylhydrolase [Phocaeicola dorei]|uniref:Family 43 glycosylhydrolase n=1 Tax=Phocaeicola dorei TaxID=357276 RepID=A0A4Q5HSZ8_9BACT|nr:family 43 glycosylhydrolase [Phocaeicola dorei]KAA5396487.1 family 43 glycosylhydrolase [Phocaeicola dorei]KAA5399065.1 family 43 glycosylhydrolase [Phocaeicola dorei]KAA5405966.1 family 43 glycosylhydrolase [Phocaeicola dorei]RYT95369.1 glycoside hydrolase [Phocaeicola dorei]